MNIFMLEKLCAPHLRGVKSKYTFEVRNLFIFEHA